MELTVTVELKEGQYTALVKESITTAIIEEQKVRQLAAMRPELGYAGYKAASIDYPIILDVLTETMVKITESFTGALAQRQGIQVHDALASNYRVLRGRGKHIPSDLKILRELSLIDTEAARFLLPSSPVAVVESTEED